MSSAFVLLNCVIGSEITVIDELNKMNGVSALRVSGIYDVIAKLGEASKEEIGDQVRKIRYIGHVRSSLTMIVAK
jgi:hypothetical protein